MNAPNLFSLEDLDKIASGTVCCVVNVALLARQAAADARVVEAAREYVRLCDATFPYDYKGALNATKAVADQFQVLRQALEETR